MRRARLVLDSGGIAGYLDSRLLRLWWMPYPIATGGRTRVRKRREAMVVVVYEVKRVKRKNTQQRPDYKIYKYKADMEAVHSWWYLYSSW